SVITNVSNYGPIEKTNACHHEMYEHMVISGMFPPGAPAPTPSSSHVPVYDYDGVLEVYELFQALLEEIRDTLPMSTEMKSEYQKAARAEYLYNLGPVTSYVAVAASSVGIKSLVDVVASW